MRSFPQIPLIDADSMVWASCCAAKDDEPVENIKHTLKLKMQNIVDKFDRGLSFKCYLTGKDNYRYDVATIRPYKGNRTQPKPRWFQEARDYLCEYWRAVVIDGMEADDAIGIEQYKHPDLSTCIVSIDKDMLTVPGWHYSWRNDNHLFMSLLEANRFFYRQLLTGDPTDNIQGCPGVGKVTAERLLAGCKSEQEMRKVVEEQYSKKKWENLTWQEALQENARLLWIMREENKWWT